MEGLLASIGSINLALLSGSVMLVCGLAYYMISHLLPREHETEKHLHLQKFVPEDDHYKFQQYMVKLRRLPHILSPDYEIPTWEWPYELILVRHGESEGNKAVAKSKNGDLSSYTKYFKSKHSSAYRLTKLGVEQAKISGQWLRENISEVYDRFYTSEYVRAMETAALLDIHGAQWLTEIVLRERDKGLLDNTSWEERFEKYQGTN
eukprot:GEZU01016896.1.p1 GENE.GEZU01016896.1~~GEZU01016896.1.p1  ORF type:complete len:206 (+),score=45.70 GEZU01016896.1:98-715(+)